MGFDLCFGTHYHSTTTSFIGIAHTAYTIYIATGWEIGSFYILHQPFDINIVIVNIGNTCINNFRKVMGRHVCCHTYSNTGCSVDQQVRNTRRHHRWFLQCIIKVILEINSLFIKILHHFFTDFLQSGLCITHGSWAVTIYRTEVTLTIYQWISHSPVLSHSDQGTIHGRVTVRVIFTQNFTYNSC